MRIGIDARFLTHPQLGGFKTYTRNLIAALAEVDGENEYVLYLDRAPDAQTALPDRPNFTAQIVPGEMPMLGVLWREQVSLVFRVARDKLDLLHSPCLTAPLCSPCRTLVTIHDMIWRYPQQFANGAALSIKRRLMQWYYRRVPEWVAQRAAAVITVSQAAKESIVQHLGIVADQIVVTHEAASSLYHPVGDPRQIVAVQQKYQLPERFILAIGSADPRKNLRGLLRAYASLPKSLRVQHRLTIVWTHNFLAPTITAEANTLGLGGQIQFLERVPNDDLALLYNAAALFVFPSFYEGFGLPLLEAMACGTPVVAANNSSIPEIVGEAALLIEAKDVLGIAAAMTQVLTDDALRQHLIEKGLKRAAGFSWARCASETVGVYKKVVAR